VRMRTHVCARYPSCLRKPAGELGPMTADEARRRVQIFRGQRAPDHMLEGTPGVRRRWHNQKYFTWVEQQGKSVAELRALEGPAFCVQHQERGDAIDRALRGRRASV